jgi:hypothetical protein
MATSPFASTSGTSGLDRSCSQCEAAAARYTCPGCAARTCSVPCAKAHKAATGCSGVRNPAAFVPMNAYSYGSLMSDYTFLEDLGRKSDGVKAGHGDDGRGGQKARDRERVLRNELTKAGFGAVRWLPPGMEAKRQNQTRFNPKCVRAVYEWWERLEPVGLTLTHPLARTRALQLTVSVAPAASPSAPKLVHSLAPTDLLHTLPALFDLPPPTEGAPLVLLLPHPTTTAAAPVFYPPTPVVPDGAHTLADALRHRAWIEWPRFQLWPSAEWEAALAEGKTKIVAEDAVEMPETAAGVKQRVWGKRPAEAEGDGQSDAKRQQQEPLGLLKVVGDMRADSADGEAQLDEAKAAAIKEVLGLGGMLGDYGSDSGED